MTKRRHVGAVAGVLALCLAAGGAAFAQSGKTPAGHPDLTGTYDNAGDLATAASAVVAKPGQSVCIFGCGPPPVPGAANAGRGPGGGGPPGGGGLRLPPKEAPKYKPEFLAKVKDLTDRQVDEDPSLRCAQPGVPRIGPPEKIVQNDKEVVFLYEDIAGPLFRVIPTDGRKHRTDLDRSPQGDSVGRWEGDTLVIETVNFTDETWLHDNGAFHTKNLRVVEKIRRIEGGGVQWDATAYDPEVLAEPWVKIPRKMPPAKNEITVQSQCKELSLVQMLDKTYHDNPR